MPLAQPPQDEAWTLGARWVFPADGPPLYRGQVTILNDRIVGIGAECRTADIDLGDAALLPGLVNAHTHLDLSNLRGQCPPTPDLTAWLCALRARRNAMNPEQIQQAVANGLAECLRFGTTLVGDISAFGASWSLAQKAALRSVVFYELLGLTRQRAELTWQAARTWIDSVRATDQARPGLSPHAPYSVRRDLFEQVANYAGSEAIPVAIHLAESAAELDLLARHAGPFVDFLQELNVWDPEGLIADCGEVTRTFTGQSTLLIHGNYLPPECQVTPQQTVVYCPRTHAAFGHGPYPLLALLARGTRVALGTDSLASNPDLDILAEARFVHQQFPEVSGEALLRMLTVSGAEALGWQTQTGSLTPGKSADLVAVPLAEGNEPFQAVWQSTHPVQHTLFRGRWTKQ
jgi:cytosine/adenosine deaminase-related metal-dependent hydrolase